MNTSQSLKEIGLKATLPRRTILELFETSKLRHLSAEDVYKALIGENIDIGLATVYRVLTQFEAAGLVARHHFDGVTAMFELNEGSHHDHLVCLACGRVEEFMDAGIEEKQMAIADKYDFEIQDHSMTLYGRCARCRQVAKSVKEQVRVRR